MRALGFDWKRTIVVVSYTHEDAPYLSQQLPLSRKEFLLSLSDYRRGDFASDSQGVILHVQFGWKSGGGRFS